jgi:hypothetical protein
MGPGEHLLSPRQLAESRIAHRANRKAIRQRILNVYGRQCSNCGYKKDERALQLDHIDGHPERYKERSGYTLYSAILSGLIPETSFQILCANCNFIKRLTTPSENRMCLGLWLEEPYESWACVVHNEIIEAPLLL